MKKLMAVLRTVPTPMDHTLAAVILATALAVMDTPAMVLNNNYSSDLGVHWTHKSQISMSVKRKSISVLKGAPILLVPIHVTVMLAIHWALMKLPALVRPLKVWSLLSTVLSSHRH